MIDIKLVRERPRAASAPASAPAVRTRGSSTRSSPPTSARRSSLTEFEQLRAEQKSFGKQVAPRPRARRRPALRRAGQGDARDAGQGAAGRRPTRAERELDRAAAPGRQRRRGRRAGRRRGRLRRAARRRHRRATSPPRASSRATTSSSASGSAPSTWSAAPRSAARGSTSSPASAPGSSWRCSTWRSPRRVEAGFTPMITPTLVKPEVMAGAGFLDAHADEVYRLEADDLYLTGTSEVALAGYHADEILDLSDGPKRYAGWSACYRREAGSLRQGHPRHHPRAPVPQGRDVQLLPARGRRGRAPAAARLGGARCWPRSSCPTASSTSPPATSAARPRASSTARRGCRPRAATAS